MASGWVKVYRKLLDNPVVCKDSDYLAVWVYLLLSAAHNDYSVIFKGEKITLKPGQLITGRKSISQKLKIDESKIQRILSLYENEQQIKQQTTNQNRLISILQWNEYQEYEQQNETLTNNGCTTDEHPVNTIKKVKNSEKKVDKVKEIYADLPPELQNSVEDFIAHRKAIKRPMTDNALRLMLKNLNTLSGGDVQTSIKILEQSVLNGWQGIFPLKNESQTRKGGSSCNPFLDLLREEQKNGPI